MAKFETYASGAIWWQNMQLMQVAPRGAQNWNQCKLYYMLAKFGTNASGATCWSNFELMQVAFFLATLVALHFTPVSN